LQVRARLSPAADLPLSDAEQFFREVNDNCRVALMEAVYARGTLQYNGLAWRGELWLDNNTRLAPPSLQDETATIGPRIVHVDANLECIGQPDVPYARHQMLVEVSAFLSVATRKAVSLLGHGRAWTLTPDMTACEIRHLGYLEPANPLSLPAHDTAKRVPLYPADNPPLGIHGSTNEISLRADIADLWILFRSLGAGQRLQFLQAAAKWQEAVIHWQDRPSLSFALMAVSCEALKPSGADERQNCYDVIEALVGKQIVDRIRRNPFPAQHVRSTHLHSGEFHGSEVIMMDFMRTYEDPSFREAHGEMARVTPAAIIEWLKRRGAFDLAPTKKRRTVRRWLRDNLVITLVVALGLGAIIGWLLRAVAN
jgi:hypothetical protein